MIPEHVKYLRCPATKRSLELKAEIIANGNVKLGYLYEPVSGNQYPIINFIPRFVPLDNYANNFGLEWNKHSRTQFDDSSGFNISKKRFEKETKWGNNLKNELILEVGSGSGRFTKHAVETSAMVISFDYSNAVGANYRSNGQNENLLIVQASIFEMPFELEFFDRVFCFGVLQHTPNPKEGFKCLVQSIKPGGYISSDIYLKSFVKLFSGPKYFIRKFTKKYESRKII